MPPRVDGDGLLSRLADLERRLEALERSPRLTSASIHGGSLVVRDADGDQRVVLGLQADGSYGLTTWDEEGDDEVWSSARAASAWAMPVTNADGDVTASITSGTYQTVGVLNYHQIAARCAVPIELSIPAGTVGKARLLDSSGVGTAFGEVTGLDSTYDFTAGVGAGQVVLTGALPDGSSTSPVRVEVQVARTSGAGTILVRAGKPAAFYG